MLGSRQKNILKLKCPDEFTDEEISEYIKKNTKLTFVPEWIPRKPLICQLLARLDPTEIEQLEKSPTEKRNFLKEFLMLFVIVKHA